jgi:hypothetical protein
MVDSGADNIVISYSIGKKIGLQGPTAAELESPSHMNGIGGRANFLERPCRVKLIDEQNNKIVVFEEKVYWIFPDAQTQNRLQNLTTQLEELQAIKGRSIETETPKELLDVLRDKISSISAEMSQIDEFLEAGQILGRTFFDNFEYITFHHQDRTREHECYFEYKIREEKIVQELEIRPSSSTLAKKITK